MYTSYLTRETFENEHDEKMTRKFSYNYQVLKRLFPEVYKLPESEIRSLVHSIYDNPKMGDELLDHLSDVINKKKPEWGEYLKPKPEEPEQPVQQQNPLQPVQPKPLNMSSGFESYKPQKSTFGLNNTNNFGNTGGFGGLNNFGGLKQSQLPNFSKGMDLKHSDMVTGFGINEAKHKEMLGTGFQMPKLPKMPQFPKAPEPQTPEIPQMPEISQALHVQSMPQYPQIQLANSAYNNQPPMPLAKPAPVPQRSFFNDYLIPEFKQDLSDIAYGANRTLNGMTFGELDYLGNKFDIDTQMNGYLNTFSPEQQVLRQIPGKMAQYGGAGLILLDGGNATTIPLFRWNGRRNLLNQLRNGGYFTDINFGRLSNDIWKRINMLRQQEGLGGLARNSYIPKNVVKKLFEKRIMKNGYTPEEVVRMLQRLFQEKGGKVSESNYPHIQQVSKPGEGLSDVGYISTNPANNQTVIKSVYKKESSRL